MTDSNEIINDRTPDMGFDMKSVSGVLGLGRRK